MRWRRRWTIRSCGFLWFHFCTLQNDAVSAYLQLVLAITIYRLANLKAFKVRSEPQRGLDSSTFRPCSSNPRQIYCVPFRYNCDHIVAAASVWNIVTTIRSTDSAYSLGEPRAAWQVLLVNLANVSAYKRWRLILYYPQSECLSFHYGQPRQVLLVSHPRIWLML